VRGWLAEIMPRRATISLPELAAQVMAAQYQAIAAAAKGCDTMMATGLFSSVAAARSVADQQGMRYVFAGYCPMFLPSRKQRPLEYPNHPHPAGVTDNVVLWERDVEVMNAVFGGGLNALRVSQGLPPVDNVRDYVFTDRPVLAADPILAPCHEPIGKDVLQTGAWILSDERPLPHELVRFLNAGSPPVYIGFGSIPVSKEYARIAIDVVRAQGRRVLLSRGWAELALVDARDDCFVIGEINQQALFKKVAAVIHHGGAGTTTVAARAGCPQVIVPQIGDQPYWGNRVRVLGIGAVLNQAMPTSESLSEALANALNPQVLERACEVSSEIVGDGAARAAELLLAQQL